MSKLPFFLVPGDNISPTCATHVRLLLPRNQSTLGIDQGHVLESTCIILTNQDKKLATFSQRQKPSLSAIRRTYHISACCEKSNFMTLPTGEPRSLPTINLAVLLQSMSVLTHTSGVRGRAYYMDTRSDPSSAIFLQK